MENVLYLECAAGISGDMAAAALLDVGASEQAVRCALDSLPVEGFEVRISRVRKSGLDVCDFAVVLDEAHENHDHDMAYLHGGPTEVAVDGEAPECHGKHAHAHGRTHTHGLAHASAFAAARAHADTCVHRGMPEIMDIIDAADMSAGAKRRALDIFEVIARAEACAHGVALDEVHFHEVGAVDSIADIVAVATALDNLAPREIVVTELAEGRGTVRCQHGVLPVPVPAVANIARDFGIALRVLDVQGELVTPTGAAIAAASRTSDRLPAHFVIKRVGMGAGKRDYATSGILRAMLLEEAPVQHCL